MAKIIGITRVEEDLLKKLARTDGHLGDACKLLDIKYKTGNARLNRLRQRIQMSDDFQRDVEKWRQKLPYRTI